MQKNKIGVGIITCNRPKYFKECYNSIDKNKVDEIVVVNDGKPLPEDINLSSEVFFIQNKENLGVSKTKNKALKHLLDTNCEHIFILEDDCIIKNNNVWEKYIQAYNITNIPHFNYGPASPWNRKQDNPEIVGDLTKRHLAKQDTQPIPKLTVQYNTDFALTFYTHIVAMFTYFNRSILEDVGLLDEKFYNAWEHVEHTYRIIKKGKYSPFWWFADVEGSEKYIKEAKDEKANSSLASNEEEFFKNTQKGLQHFYNLHSTVPSHIQPATQQQVVEFLKKIKNESK
jgi:GT2 family glycosyltransferase